MEDFADLLEGDTLIHYICKNNKRHSMTAIHQLPKTKKRRISWTTFEKKYLIREDGYRYEWLDGTIEKTKKMNKTQLFILRNLQDFFMKLKFDEKVKGQLIAEADLFFGKHHRRPDICWLTDKQIDKLSQGEYEIPAFIIEVISTNDMMNNVEDKMNDYRIAGVQVVWQIFPNQKAVHIYTGKNLKDMEVHTENMLCSAAPALKHFKIRIPAIFERKVD